MPEPSRSSPRSGRLGLLALLVAPVVVVTALTQWQTGHRPVGSAAVTDAGGEDTAGVRVAFGSVTAQGAILFEVGQPVHLRSMGADGSVRWQRDLVDGEVIACGPCPGAVLGEPDGSTRAIAPTGDEGAGPAQLGDHLIPTRSLEGVVLAAGRADGSVELFSPTSAGLVSAGSVADAGLDQALVVVTPAVGGGAVTIMRASADPLRQGEFEVEHVTPAGAVTTVVPLDAPQSHPLPCTVADVETVAYVQIDPGPTADGTTHVVADRGGQRVLDARIAGSFDTCAVGADGAVLSASANGADGDLSRTRVDVTWIAPGGAVRATAREQVVATTASVALDPSTGRVAIAGGDGPAVVVDPDGRHERASARAVAFDDTGGLWWAQSTSQITREEAG